MVNRQEIENLVAQKQYKDAMTMLSKLLQGKPTFQDYTFAAEIYDFIGEHITSAMLIKIAILRSFTLEPILPVFKAGLYEAGEGVTRDYVKAVEYYRQSAEQGYVVAIFNLGVMWENGIGLPADLQKATHFYQLAGEAGLAAAQFNLGVILENDAGEAGNMDQARYWFGKAAEQGHTEAKKQLDRLRKK